MDSQKAALYLVLAFCCVLGSCKDRNTNKISRIKNNAFYGFGRNSICLRNIKGSLPELCQEKAILGKGRVMAFQQCKKSFQDRKWNCTNSSYRRMIRSGTREGAFLNAIISAGYVYGVTKACFDGELWQCRCDRTQTDTSSDGQWEWSGCSHDVDVGFQWAKRYTDQFKYNRDIKGRIYRHNNEAGRLAITTNMERVCRCHGLSGSCTLQTCWKKMPNFEKIGTLLLERYDGAPKVTGSNDGSRLIPEEKSVKKPTRRDLVYSESSPNFCVPNKRFGTFGTRGRECEPESSGTNGCDILCCERGFRKVLLYIKENCNCIFKWCCEVHCQTCIRKRTAYLCN